MDLELTGETDPSAIGEALARQLPPGIAVRAVRLVTARHAALMAVVNLAAYRVRAPLAAGAAGRPWRPSTVSTPPRP
jgi:uncharacterized protein (DUF2344 family)